MTEEQMRAQLVQAARRDPAVVVLALCEAIQRMAGAPGLPDLLALIEQTAFAPTSPGALAASTAAPSTSARAKGGG